MSLFERPRSLTELVTDSLKQKILDGEFELGEQLSEADIENLGGCVAEAGADEIGRKDEWIVHSVPMR